MRFSVASIALMATITVYGTSSSQASTPIRPGIVVDVGGLGDRGFNDLAKTGLLSAQKALGITGKILVPATPADYISNLGQFATDGSNPVFGIGFTFADAIAAAAKQYPTTHFAIVDSVVDAPNVTSLVFREQEGSYLAGVVAGMMTQRATAYTNKATKVVGFIAALKAPLIDKFGAGYEQGVKSVCPKCVVLYQYIGTTGAAFGDPGTAKEIALNMYAKGADVIYHAAGGSGDGLFQAAQEKKFFAIGVNVNQAITVPSAPILTSVLKRVDTAVKAVITAEVAGQFKGGVQSFGLSNDGIALTPFGRFSSLVPASVKRAVATAKAKIINGKIKVAETLAEVK
ncbi:MAG: BMP family ABC transporter substrate-binding protein [Candidatus Nanopelagicaceae bacterium]|nr:BMP family ABC transporter substrate-binding protein [Candidatus Nanopelagicaceae bacterium]